MNTLNEFYKKLSNDLKLPNDLIKIIGNYVLIKQQVYEKFLNIKQSNFISIIDNKIYTATKNIGIRVYDLRGQYKYNLPIYANNATKIICHANKLYIVDRSTDTII